VKGLKPRGAQGFASCAISERTCESAMPTEELGSPTAFTRLASIKAQIAANTLRATADAHTFSFLGVFRRFMVSPCLLVQVNDSKQARLVARPIFGSRIGWDSASDHQHASVVAEELLLTPLAIMDV
jgi:hypothetical protein